MKHVTKGPMCGTRVCSMTVSDKCATHVLDRRKSESRLAKAPAQHTCESVLVVSEFLSACVQENTQRHKPKNAREMRSCWETVNNTPPHVNRESGVTQQFEQGSHTGARQTTLALDQSGILALVSKSSKKFASCTEESCCQMMRGEIGDRLSKSRATQATPAVQSLHLSWNRQSFLAQI